MEVFHNKNLIISFQPEIALIRFEWDEEDKSYFATNTMFSSKTIFEKFIPTEFLLPKDKFYVSSFTQDHTWIDSRIFFCFTRQNGRNNVVIVSSELFSRVDIKPTKNEEVAQDFINQFFKDYRNVKEWVN